MIIVGNRACMYACNLLMHAGTAGGHFGRDRTIDKICSRFYWKSMVEEIREYVKNCSQCQRMNPAFVKTNAKLHPISVQPKVWHQVYVHYNFYGIA